MSHTDRISFAQSQLAPNQAILCANPLDVYYLSGFVCLTPGEREALLLITQHSAHLFLSSFSAPTDIEGLKTHVGGVERILKELLPTFLEQDTISTLHIDGNELTVNEYEYLKTIVPAQIEFQLLKESPIAVQRRMKDSPEIEAITKANALTHQALSFTQKKVQVGMTEQEVQEIFEKKLYSLGVKEFAFPTIVAFGKHSALPHHQPSSTKLTENEAILIDCGAKWDHYCADVTRTWWFGDTPDPEFIKIETLVQKAYKKTVEYINQASSQKQPITAASIDKVARDVITIEGFGAQFIHTTGHGVGLHIHEHPSLNPRNETLIAPHMVITVEPGIYLPERFGYRFENSLVITSKGISALTS